MWGALSLKAHSAFNDFVSDDLNSTYATSLPDRQQAWFATADQDEFNQTIRFIYDGEKLRGSFGLFYSEENDTVIREGVALQNAFGSGLDLAAVINSPTDTETRAIFGEFDYKQSEQLTITLGGRYEQLDLDAVSSLSANLILPPPAPFTIAVPDVIDGIADASTDFSIFLPKLGLTWALNKYENIGFTYSEGYRQGGITIDPTTAVIDEFDTEQVKNYEFSYKSAYSNGFSLNANLFYLDWSDQQINQTPDGTPFALTLNAGNSTVYGAELETGYRTKVWDAYFSVGYTETEFDDFEAVAGDFTGNEFPNAPNLTLAGGAFYTFGDWTIGAEANYRDGFYFNADNLEEAESLLLVDLTADYRMDKLTVRGYISNVFDQVERITNTFEIEGVPQTSLNEPRTCGVQLMYGF